MYRITVPLASIAALVDGVVEGDPGTLIHGPGSLEEAETGHIVFVDRPELLAIGEESDASALIVSSETRTTAKPVVVTEDPRLAFSKVLDFFAPEPRVAVGTHPTAVLGSNVSIGEGVSIGAHAVIGDNVVIKDRAIIYPLAYIGHEATIGEDTLVSPHVFVGDRVVIGDRCHINAGSAIGADGFGFLQTAHGHRKIPQIGTVIVGNDVEIGACSTVDRATVAATRIGDGTKIDDQVHVAHNCIVGSNCLLCGQVGIAGSSTIGNNVVMGGQVGVSDHVTICDDAVIAGGGEVFGSIDTPGVYSGQPARPHYGQLRVSAAARRMPDVLKKVKHMEQRLAELEARLESSEGAK